MKPLICSGCGAQMRREDYSLQWRCTSVSCGLVVTDRDIQARAVLDPRTGPSRKGASRADKEIADLRAQLAETENKLAAAEKAMRDDANAGPDTVAYWRTKAEDWERWWQTFAQVRTGRGVRK